MEVETLSETGSLWGRVLDTKYGEFTRDYETRVVGGGSLWWRDLQIICAGETDWFKKNVRINVGDRVKSLFWHDKWATKDGMLKLNFQRLFDLSLN